MADKEKLKEWVESKLEKGVEPERIKKSLEKTGNDPSIVDEVQDPFDGTEETDSSVFDDSGEKEEEETTPEPPETGNNTEETDSSTEDDTGIKNRFRGVREGLPDLNPPLRPLAALLIIGVLAGGYTVLDTGNVADDIRGIFTTDIDAIDQERDCPDVGVLMGSVSADNGVTSADVVVSQAEAEVVLEIYRDGERIDYTVDSFQGEKSLEAGSVGDRAVFRPLGCPNRGVEGQIVG